MKRIIVLMVLILLTSGCTVSKKTAQETSCYCTPCEEKCRKQCDEEIAKAQAEAEALKPRKHEIDLAEERCLKKAYSNADMRNCSYDAMDAWFLEIDKELKTLKKLLPAEQYEKVLKSQRQWKKYQEFEFDANNAVFMSKMGHYYYVISVGYKNEIVKDRALLLNSYIQTAKEP